MRVMLISVIAVAGWCLSTSSASLPAAEAERFGPDPQLYQTTVGRAIRFLAAEQSEDGSLSPQIGIGPTALATLGLLRSGRTPADPQVAKGLKYLEEYTQESGGIHMPGGRIPTYETCIALVCFKAGQPRRAVRQDHQDRRGVPSPRPMGREPRQGQVRPVLRRRGLRRQVAARPVEHRLSDRRPEGLRRRPRRPGHPEGAGLRLALPEPGKRAQHHPVRRQGRTTAGSTTPACWAARTSERETADGGLRSYGSMTYSGLKSMIYAGLTQGRPAREGRPGSGSARTTT